MHRISKTTGTDMSEQDRNSCRIANFLGFSHVCIINFGFMHIASLYFAFSSVVSWAAKAMELFGHAELVRSGRTDE